MRRAGVVYPNGIGGAPRESEKGLKQHGNSFDVFCAPSHRIERKENDAVAAANVRSRRFMLSQFNVSTAAPIGITFEWRNAIKNCFIDAAVAADGRRRQGAQRNAWNGN